MPFWEALSRKPMEMAEIKQIYLSLSDKVREMIVAKETNPPRRLTAFWRIPTDWDTLYSRLYEIGDLDAATAVLTLIKEYEATQNYDAHESGLTYWGKIARKLQQYPPLAPLIPEINNIIGNYYSIVLYPSQAGGYEQITEEFLSHALAGRTF